MSEIKSWRTPKPHKPNFGSVVCPLPATHLFDRLSFIGTPIVGCFVIETSAGLIMIDCMDPVESDTKIILNGFAELGLDPHDLKAILISHGHGDHYGTADYFRANFGCKIYMSKVDYEFAKTNTSGPMGALTWDIYDYLEDGGVFTLGDTSIRLYSTPGHTPGCMSFIIPVTDEGRPHLAALWGGTGMPYYLSEKALYLESTLRFAAITEALGVDAEISTHPFVDRSTDRMAVLRNISDGVPNPFVLGRENYKYYEKLFTDMCISAIKQQSAEADKLLPPPPKRPRRK